MMFNSHLGPFIFPMWEQLKCFLTYALESLTCALKLPHFLYYTQARHLPPMWNFESPDGQKSD